MAIQLTVVEVEPAGAGGPAVALRVSLRQVHAPQQVVEARVGRRKSQ